MRYFFWGVYIRRIVFRGTKVTFPNFFPNRYFHFGTPQKNFSDFKKWIAKKSSSAHFHIFPPSIFSFLKFSSPFFTILLLSIFLFSLPLFSLSSYFPSPFPFPPFPFLPKFPPKTFQGWATRPHRPPVVTPLLLADFQCKHQILIFPLTNTCWLQISEIGKWGYF